MGTQGQGVQVIARDSPFDYAPLSAPIRSALKVSTLQLRALTKNVACDLWRMGEILADAKERLAAYGNGTFIHWAKDEAGLNRKAAYRLIYIYRAFDLDNLSKTTLAKSALHVLSEPSTPPEARAEALWRAERGEPISHAKAQEIVQQYRPLSPSLPPRPTKPELPPLPPSPEYVAFEKETLMPRLHDAGIEDAPQMLSGKQVEPQAVPEERKEQAGESLRHEIIEAVRGVDTEDEAALGECASEIMGALGQSMGSIAIAARFGEALSSGPRTLADLTALAIWACDACQDGMERDTHLKWRKRALRIMDSLTYCGGLPIFQHTLSNGQTAYSLLPPDSDA